MTNTLTLTPDLLADPGFKTFVTAFSEMLNASSSLPLEQARKMCADFFLSQITEVEPVKSVTDRIIQSYDTHPIPVRIFTPNGSHPFPILVFFHRGGWVFGSIEETEPLCRKLANRFQCIVAAVGYRLSPEYKFPKALEDCYAATEWISEHALSLSGNPHQLMVGGESAGGNLAAAVTLMARERGDLNIAQQVLLCPILRSDLQESVYAECPDQYFLTKDAMSLFWNMYLPTSEDGANPYASPIKAPDLSRLPPTFIATAEFDPLRQEGEEYACRLKSSGVLVHTMNMPGVIHGFLDLPIYAEAEKNRAIEAIAHEVNQMLSASSDPLSGV